MPGAYDKRYEWVSGMAQMKKDGGIYVKTRMKEMVKKIAVTAIAVAVVFGGGLADAFDESKSAWAGEYRELKSLLSDAEYASARESTLNAHYTSPVIIRSIYEALGNMGFEKGNVLDEAVT